MRGEKHWAYLRYTLNSITIRKTLKQFVKLIGSSMNTVLQCLFAICSTALRLLSDVIKCWRKIML